MTIDGSIHSFKFFSTRKGILLVLFGIVVCIGWLRANDLFYWYEKPQLYFFEEAGTKQPILVNPDGYYYMETARELAEGEYTRRDEDRNIPEGTSRPDIPPLLSLLLAGVHKVTDLSYEWSAIFFSSVLCLLLVPILYILGASFGGYYVGFLCVLFTFLSPGLTERTQIGWFDTDCLNIVFTAAATVLSMKIVLNNTFRQRILYFFGLLAVYGLFIWWWQQIPIVVTGIVFLPLIAGGIVYYRPSKREAVIIAAAFLLAGGGVSLMRGGELLNFRSLFNLLTYITKSQDSLFPVTGAFVGEQQPPGFLEIAQQSTGHIITFGAALIGIGLLIYQYRYKSLFFSNLLILGALTFLAGRFIIFLAPVTGLGLAFLLKQIWDSSHRMPLIRVTSPFLFLAIAIAGVDGIEKMNKNRARRYPWHFSGMKEVRQKTTEDAVVWATYGHGYPMLFYARRGTFSDGKYHGGKQLYLLNRPLVHSDFQLAANWLNFYLRHGQSGFDNAQQRLETKNWPQTIDLLEDIFEAGPEKTKEILKQKRIASNTESTMKEMLAFFFPSTDHSLYIFLDKLHIRLPWYLLGSWDLRENKSGNRYYTPFSPVSEMKEGVYVGMTKKDEQPINVNGHRFMFGRYIQVDIEEGKFTTGNYEGPLSHFAKRVNGDFKVRSYDREKGFRFEVLPEKQFGVLMGHRTKTAIYNKLFVRQQYDRQYFEPVINKTPRFQLWKIKPDVFSSQADERREEDKP